MAVLEGEAAPADTAAPEATAIPVGQGAPTGEVEVVESRA